MPNTLKGLEYIYNHPEARAKDLMDAFKDEEIKAIICNIGGDDTIRLLPYTDFDIICDNPKIFMGFSDTTANHFMCYKAGLSSFYGPLILAGFAENVEMHDYTKHRVDKVLFDNNVIGEIKPSTYWTSEYLEWTNSANNMIKRNVKTDNKGYEIINGTGKVTGRLIGGCIEVMEFLKGTILWPSIDEFKGKILFFETSEDKPDPDYVKWWLRNYVAIGIIDVVNGIIFSKPIDEVYYEEYKKVIKQVIVQEAKREDLPILYNFNCGHTDPMCILPLNALAEINCENKSFTILESEVK